MTTSQIFLALLLLAALVFCLPVWPYSRTVGPYPSSALGVVFAILVIYVLFSRNGILHGAL